MNKKNNSAIFGMNFLQDMKGDSDEITGAYDPEQELWIMQEPVQLDEEALANVTGGLQPQVILSDGQQVLRGLLGESAHPPKIDRPGGTKTHKETRVSTRGGSDTGFDKGND